MTTATAATRTVAEASTQTDSTQTDDYRGVVLVAVHEAAVQAEADARQRVMEAQVAKMSVMVGFVSAGISAAIAGTVAMFRTR